MGDRVTDEQAKGEALFRVYKQADEKLRIEISQSVSVEEVLLAIGSVIGMIHANRAAESGMESLQGKSLDESLACVKDSALQAMDIAAAGEARTWHEDLEVPDGD